MKIIINLDLRENFIQLDYRRAMVSFIKSAIEGYSKSLYLTLYCETALQKSFAFDVKFFGPVFKEKIIVLDQNRMVFTIITNDATLGIDIYNSFVKIKNKPYTLADGNTMKATAVRIENHDYINAGEVVVNMLTPLVIRKHIKGEKDFYYRPSDNEFLSAFEYCVKNQLKNLVGAEFGDEAEFVIEPIKPRETVVKTFGLSIPCTLGMFRIKGDKRLINVLYQSGVGSRRSEGFGVFEIIQ